MAQDTKRFFERKCPFIECFADNRPHDSRDRRKCPEVIERAYAPGRNDGKTSITCERCRRRYVRPRSRSVS